MKPNKYQ